MMYTMYKIYIKIYMMYKIYIKIYMMYKIYIKIYMMYISPRCRGAALAGTV